MCELMKQQETHLKQQVRYRDPGSLTLLVPSILHQGDRRKPLSTKRERGPGCLPGHVSLAGLYQCKRHCTR